MSVKFVCSRCSGIRVLCNTYNKASMANRIDGNATENWKKKWDEEQMKKSKIRTRVAETRILFVLRKNPRAIVFGTKTSQKHTRLYKSTPTNVASDMKWPPNNESVFSHLKIESGQCRVLCCERVYVFSRMVSMRVNECKTTWKKENKQMSPSYRAQTRMHTISHREVFVFVAKPCCFR